MYILVWKDNKGVYEEDDFQNRNEIVYRLLELSRKEYAKEHGTRIISFTKGELVDFEYRRDSAVEKLIISGKVASKVAVAKAKLPEPDMDCPVCGSAAGLLDENISVGSYRKMTLFGCSECSREFCA